MGNSLILFPLMLRYRNEVHSEKRTGRVESWLCERASLHHRDKVSASVDRQVGWGITCKRTVRVRS